MHRRTLGVTSLMTAESGRIHNQADLVLAEDIGLAVSVGS